MITSKKIIGFWIASDLTQLPKDLRRILNVQVKEFIHFLDEGRTDYIEDGVMAQQSFVQDHAWQEYIAA